MEKKNRESLQCTSSWQKRASNEVERVIAQKEDTPSFPPVLKGWFYSFGEERRIREG